MFRRHLLLALPALGLPRGRAAAQEAPLRIVFPFAAGGAADAVARLLVAELAIRLNRPVLVDNRTGAGGRIGALAVKAGPADGTMLLLAAGAQMTLAPLVEAAVEYDPDGDFRPITKVMRFGQVIAVGPQNPAGTIADLVGWLRADPARWNFGSPGIGTGAHFAGAEFARLAGLELAHVAYRGTPPAIPDLQTGRLSLFVAAFPEFREHQAAGRVRILASTEALRSPAMPTIPTLHESGFDIVAPGWFALYAPVQTPDAIAARLTAAVQACLGNAGLRARIAALGFEPTGLGPIELADTQREDTARWRAMVRASSFRPE